MSLSVASGDVSPFRVCSSAWPDNLARGTEKPLDRKKNNASEAESMEAIDRNVHTTIQKYSAITVPMPPAPSLSDSVIHPRATDTPADSSMAPDIAGTMIRLMAASIVR